MSRTALAPGLPRDRDGYEYGTAAQLAGLLASPGKPVTAGMIRKWAWRSRNPADRLHGMLPVVRVAGARTGHSYYRLLHAAQVAALIEAGIR